MTWRRTQSWPCVAKKPAAWQPKASQRVRPAPAREPQPHGMKGSRRRQTTPPPAHDTFHSNPMCSRFFMRAAVMRLVHLGSRPASRCHSAANAAQGRVGGEPLGPPGVAVLLHELPQRLEALVPHVWLHHPLEPDVLQLLHARHSDTHGATGLSACLAHPGVGVLHTCASSDWWMRCSSSSCCCCR